MIETPNSVKILRRAQRTKSTTSSCRSWYSVDGDGPPSREVPDPEVMKAASDRGWREGRADRGSRSRKLNLRELVHHRGGQKEPAFIDALLGESKKNGYSGFQIDFENVELDRPRSALGLRRQTAAALHEEHLSNSRIATVPNAPGWPGKSPYSHWLYAN